jgi:hypothetical protein
VFRILISRFLIIACLCACLFLTACGNETTTTQTLALTPNSFDITVDSGTGMATGATPIQATLNGDPFDLTMLLWRTESSTAPVGCIGVDQTGVPHCNASCGNSFNGTLKATIISNSTSTIGTSATITVNCTIQ